MKNLVKKLMKTFGRAFNEDDEEKLHDEIKALVDEKETRITALTQDVTTKDAKITALEPLAADGKAFREDLVTQYVTAKAKLGEVAETPEAQKVVRDVAGAYPISFLQAEVKTLATRVAEKFPDTPQLTGDARTDKSADGIDQKDYRDPKVNPLIEDDQK